MRKYDTDTKQVKYGTHLLASTTFSSYLLQSYFPEVFTGSFLCCGMNCARLWSYYRGDSGALFAFALPTQNSSMEKRDSIHRGVAE